MQLKSLTLLLLAAFALGGRFSSLAAPITWSAPGAIVGDTDIATAGSPVYAYDDANSSTAVNGVPFGAANSSTSWSTNVCLLYTSPSPRD